MPLHNTFKEQRKLQNKYDKAFEFINELPMSEAAREKITDQLLSEFKSETKKIVDDKTGITDEAEEPESPALNMVVIHDSVPPANTVMNTEEVTL